MHISLHITVHIIRPSFDVSYILVRIGACIDYLRIVISWSISNILVTKICVSWALTGARVYRSYRANSVHIGGADLSRRLYLGLKIYENRKASREHRPGQGKAAPLQFSTYEHRERPPHVQLLFFDNADTAGVKTSMQSEITPSSPPKHAPHSPDARAPRCPSSIMTPSS